jgi:hypothetical protein
LIRAGHGGRTFERGSFPQTFTLQTAPVFKFS